MQVRAEKCILQKMFVFIGVGEKGGSGADDKLPINPTSDDKITDKLPINPSITDKITDKRKDRNNIGKSIEFKLVRCQRPILCQN